MPRYENTPYAETPPPIDPTVDPPPPVDPEPIDPEPPVEDPLPVDPTTPPVDPLPPVAEQPPFDPPGRDLPISQGARPCPTARRSSSSHAPTTSPASSARRR